MQPQRTSKSKFDHTLNLSRLLAVIMEEETWLKEKSSSPLSFLLHQLYLEKFEPEASVIGAQVTYEFFFNTNFNLSFGVPKTDTCANWNTNI